MLLATTKAGGACEIFVYFLTIKDAILFVLLDLRVDLMLLLVFVLSDKDAFFFAIFYV